MKMCLDCIPCFVRQALEASRMAADDEATQKEVLNEVMDRLRSISLHGKKPTDIACQVHEIVRRVTGSGDPYKRLKKEQNDMALELYDDLKEIVRNSDDRLSTATRIAIAGNIIDLGPGHEIDIEKTIDEVLTEDLTIDNQDDYRREINRADTIYFLGDNAGEIVFDRVLIEELEEKNITYFVKGGPILNDVVKEDAEYVSMDELAEIDIVSNGMPGTGPKRASEEFNERMRGSDVIISKGQGNYEALSEEDLNIFFLLRAKCPVIAEDLDVDIGDIILK